MCHHQYLISSIASSMRNTEKADAGEEEEEREGEREKFFQLFLLRAWEMEHVLLYTLGMYGQAIPST